MFSFPIHHIANSYLFEFDLSIDSLDKVPSSGIGADYQSHQELFQHSASSILVCPIQTVHQTILFEPHLLLGRLNQLSRKL